MSVEQTAELMRAIDEVGVNAFRFEIERKDSGIIRVSLVCRSSLVNNQWMSAYIDVNCLEQFDVADIMVNQVRAVHNKIIKASDQ